MATSRLDPCDRRLISDFLSGEAVAVERVQQWLEQASRPYRRRLGWQWEDLSQDLLLEVTRLLRAGAFRGRARLRTYVWSVVSHACLNRLRSDHSRLDCPLEDAAEELHTPRPSIVEEIMERESTDALLRLVMRMPEECRHLWRFLLAGASYTEISAKLGIAPGTLRVRVHRCRQRAMALWNEAGR